MTDSTNKAIAILVTDGFKDSELANPAEAVKDAGTTMHVISTEDGSIKGKDGAKVDVDKLTSSVSADDYGTLILPGGTMNVNQVHIDRDVVALAKGFTAVNRPTGVICHGGWILADANTLKGRTITSCIGVKADLVNAGADWVDEEAIVDGNLISSHTPVGLEAFDKAFVKNSQAARLSQDSSKEDCCHDFILG